MNTNTMQYLDKYVDKIGNIINELAKQLGVASEYVYNVLVKQQFVEAITSLGVMILLLGFLFIIWKYYLKYIKKDKTNSDMVFGWTLINIFSTGIIGTIIIANLLTNIPKLINPDYYAIQDIIKMLGNLK